MNNIIDLLNLKDEGIEITNIQIEGDTKIIEIQKNLVEHYCPICGERMYSRGIRVRTVRHPILQDSTKLILKVFQRRWRCTNCKKEMNDSYSFLGKNKQLTSFIPYLICEQLKDHTQTCASVAKMFNVTSMTVFNYFMQYVECKRLEMPKYLSIDEVYLNIDEKHKYALILMNFQTNEIIDIVYSRRKVDTEAYFYNIPIEERNRVKYLICDMYDPYIKFTIRYFHNAVAVVDSFHVISWLNNLISDYINQVKRKFQKRDREILDNENSKRNIPFERKSDSKEVYILKKFKWVLLKSSDNMEYSQKLHYDLKLCQYTNTYIITDMFLNLDNRFSIIKRLKDIYTNFNKRNVGKDSKTISVELDEIISLYRNTDQPIFKNFAELISHYKNEIIRSFHIIKNYENGIETIKRLSNGPMESFNRLPKDMKRLARGFSNFEYIRNRILWATRSNPSILAIPKSLDDIRPKIIIKE